jgi:hypothetical protein
VTDLWTGTSWSATGSMQLPVERDFARLLLLR